jgi:signal transduction histidine kinase
MCKLLPPQAGGRGRLAEIWAPSWPRTARSPTATSRCTSRTANWSTLAELRERQEDLLELTRELEDTNRGIVALYAEIEDKAERLRRADEMKSRFLSNTSHELRTPLSSIRALAQLLLDRLDGDLTQEQERQVKFIEKAATDLSELVNDLLDLAKIEAGKADTGIGIAPENLQFVFEEFSQIESPLQRRVKGTGLGLPLCRKLAASLGGHVELASELGKGSIFSVVLPLEYSPVSNDGARRAEPPVTASSVKGSS